MAFKAAMFVELTAERAHSKRGKRCVDVYMYVLVCAFACRGWPLTQPIPTLPVQRESLVSFWERAWEPF